MVSLMWAVFAEDVENSPKEVLKFLEEATDELGFGHKPVSVTISFSKKDYYDWKFGEDY